VVSQAESPVKCQTLAARFLDANFPGEYVEWVDAYHGLDTDMPKGRTHFVQFGEW
jgi:hypothetical protein